MSDQAAPAAEGGSDEYAEGSGEGADASATEEAAAAADEAGEPEVEAVKTLPPVELAPLPEDYVPVADLPPLPEPFARSEEGRPIPLPGVESLFLTGTTAELVGLVPKPAPDAAAAPAADAGAAAEGAAAAGGSGAAAVPASPPGPLGLILIPKEVLLEDMRFRGAISDFHIIKQRVMDADYDTLVFRANDDDVYGDGNNWMVALTREAADVWRGIEDEAARRLELAALEAAHAAAEKAKPRSQRVRKVKPWESLGSEVDIEEMSVRPRREAIRLVVQRRRREFNQPLGSASSGGAAAAAAGPKLGDKDAHELWNSSQNECRPFKDPNFDMRRMELDAATQAVAPLRTAGVQAGGPPPRPAATQTTAQDMPADAKAALLGAGKGAAGSVADFMERVRDRVELALVQNEITNIFKDDLSALSDEADGPGGGAGNRKENLISEAQSFTHLLYSKAKVVSAIQWLPHRRGVVAVSCTEALPHSERVARLGKAVASAHILVWSFKDPIHPEMVLQSPWEVAAFQFNPAQPHILAGGCYNGQVVMWDLSAEAERINRKAAAAAGGGGAGAKADAASVGGAAAEPGAAAAPAPGGAALLGSSSLAVPSAGGGGGSAADSDAHIPIVRHRFMTDTQFSHHQVVTDLQWLPGVEISHRGKVTKLADGATKECNFFATIAADGRVLFWDARVERLLKKGKKADEVLDLVWKPIHAVHLISLIGMDLGGTRFAFDPKRIDQGLFFVGSFDGELVYADFVKPEHEENPDYAKSTLQAHVGPIISLERSPFFDDVILTCGDWQWQVWREGAAATAPLFQSGYAADYYTAACWSPTRPGVAYLADQTGALEVWDLLDRSHEPSLRVQVAAAPIMSLSFNPAPPSANVTQQAAQQLLAVGDATGVLRIMELPRNLRRPVHNERKLMASWLERQEARLADVGGRAPCRAAARKEADEHKKEAEAAAAAEVAAKEAAAKDAAAAAAAGLPAPTEKKAKAAQPEFDEKAEQEYQKLEARFRQQLGLTSGGEAPGGSAQGKANGL